MISCEMDLGLDILLERIWEELRLVKYVVQAFSLPLTREPDHVASQGIHETARDPAGSLGSHLSASRGNNRNRLS